MPLSIAIRNRRKALLPIAITAALVAGCGGNDSPSGADKPSTSPSVTTTTPSAKTTPVAPGKGACQYVTAEQAGELAASPVKPGTNRTLDSGPVTFDHCDYIFDPGNSPGVLVAVADLAGQGESLFAQYRQSKASESDFQAVSGVGDEAFFAGTNLYVRVGDKGLILFVGRANGYPRGPGGIPDEKKLAELVIGKL